MPRVTILMPVRNAAAFVGPALRSMLRQSCRDFELLVLDDGSTDASSAIVGACADPRVRLIRNSAPRGVAATLNLGMSQAQGEYVARMDADDISAPQRLARQVTFLDARPQIGICGTWVRCFGDSARFVLTYPVGVDTVRSYVLFDNPLAHPTVCLRRRALEERGLRYDERLPAAQDFDLWARCANTVAMDNLPEPLLRYRVHAQSVSQAKQTASDAQAVTVLRRELSRIGLNPSPDEMQFHRAVGHGAGMSCRGEVLRAEAWLQTLLSTNRVAGVYSEEGLCRATAFVWFRLCLNSSFLGPWVWFHHRRSRLRALHQPTPSEAAVFLLQVLRAVAGGRNRRPTGGLEVWSSGTAAPP